MAKNKNRFSGCKTITGLKRARTRCLKESPASSGVIADIEHEYTERLAELEKGAGEIVILTPGESTSLEPGKEVIILTPGDGLAGPVITPPAISEEPATEPEPAAEPEQAEPIPEPEQADEEHEPTEQAAQEAAADIKTESLQKILDYLQFVNNNRMDAADLTAALSLQAIILPYLDTVGELGDMLLEAKEARMNNQPCACIRKAVDALAKAAFCEGLTFAAAYMCVTNHENGLIPTQIRLAATEVLNAQIDTTKAIKKATLHAAKRLYESRQ